MHDGHREGSSGAASTLHRWAKPRVRATLPKSVDARRNEQRRHDPLHRGCKFIESREANQQRHIRWVGKLFCALTGWSSWSYQKADVILIPAMFTASGTRRKSKERSCYLPPYQNELRAPRSRTRGLTIHFAIVRLHCITARKKRVTAGDYWRNCRPSAIQFPAGGKPSLPYKTRCWNDASGNHQKLLTKLNWLHNLPLMPAPYNKERRKNRTGTAAHDSSWTEAPMRCPQKSKQTGTWFKKPSSSICQKPRNVPKHQTYSKLWT